MRLGDRPDQQTESPAEETVEKLVGLYEQHHRSATGTQRLANRLTKYLARPATLTIIVVLVIGWIVGNLTAGMFGIRELEAFPFPDLALFATIAAFLIALLILTTQRHGEALAERRAQLTLQIALLSENKIAKVIALLEEQRRDNPMLSDRIDRVAARMAQATDPQDHLEDIDSNQIGRLAD